MACVTSFPLFYFTAIYMNNMLKPFELFRGTICCCSPLWFAGKWVLPVPQEKDGCRPAGFGVCNGGGNTRSSAIPGGY